jgi:parvulin-like peptidyl-prolyl isomerase
MATVGSSAITPDAWLATLKEFSGAQALRQLIKEQLVIDKAHRLKIDFKDAAVEAQIVRLKAQYPNERAFEAMLHERGVPLSAVRREVKTDLLLDRIVDELGKISDASVKAYYDGHLAEFTKPTRVQLYAITAPDMHAAAQAYERLAAGEDFGKVAQEVSADEHAAEGGFWGWLSADQIAPKTLQTAAFALKADSRSEPIELEGKGYILWVKAIDPGLQTSLAEATPGIRDKLRAEKGVSKEGVLRRLIRDATIKISAPEYAYLQAEYDKAKELQVIVDGQPVDLKAAPFLDPKTGRAFVRCELPSPDPFLAALGAMGEWWEAPDNTLRVTKGDTVLLLQVGNQGAGVTRAGKQEVVTVDDPPVLRGGKPFVSAKWIVEQLGGSILFVPDEYAVKIKSVKQEEAPAPMP